MKGLLIASSGWGRNFRILIAPSPLALVCLMWEIHEWLGRKMSPRILVESTMGRARQLTGGGGGIVVASAVHCILKGEYLFEQ